MIYVGYLMTYLFDSPYICKYKCFISSYIFTASIPARRSNSMIQVSNIDYGYEVRLTYSSQYLTNHLIATTLNFKAIVNILYNYRHHHRRYRRCRRLR